MKVDDSDTFPLAAPSGQQIAATADYVALRDAIVERAAAARERAARAVNTELVLLYWSIGCTILTEQQRHSWGDDVVGLLAQDLRALGDLGRGFSRRNLFYMRQFAALWPDEQTVQTLSAQIGWSHQMLWPSGGSPAFACARASAAKAGPEWYGWLVFHHIPPPCRSQPWLAMKRNARCASWSHRRS